VATGSEDSDIRLWDAATGQYLLSLSGHSAAVNDLRFSPDGKRIVSASDDGSVKVWGEFDSDALIGK
jgi:WD40 repeat protein